MGEVWLARHQLLARPAAVKLLRKRRSATEEEARALRQRFEREAHATAELQSPHTVQLYDFGVTETGSFYYVMERLRGMDLQRMVERHGPLPPERAIFLLKQACRSLSEAHALGLVHRDIKPANLFVCRLGPEYDFLKVLDFGVVSRPAREPVAPSRRPARFSARRRFSRPNWLRRSAVRRTGRHLRAWLRGLLAADRPAAVRGKDAGVLLMHHSKTMPAPPSTFAEEPIPAAVDAAVLACLAKDPADRPATADVLWERFDGIQKAGKWDQRRARSWWRRRTDLIARSDHPV